MELKLYRYALNIDSTGGLLFMNGYFFCYTVEDQYQEGEKVPGETCIPKGRYEIKFRDAGGMNETYKKNFPEHVGMLHLQNVPGFTWIYIHPGNNDNNTEGCILVARQSKFDGEITLQDSIVAYRKLYNLIKLAISQGEQVFIEIVDLV